MSIVFWIARDRQDTPAHQLLKLKGSNTTLQQGTFPLPVYCLCFARLLDAELLVPGDFGATAEPGNRIPFQIKQPVDCSHRGEKLAQQTGTVKKKRRDHGMGHGKQRSHDLSLWHFAALYSIQTRDAPTPNG